MQQLQFHPVWDRKLHPKERDFYQQCFNQLPDTDEQLYLVPCRVNYKKNGGLSLTVFIQNGSGEAFFLRELSLTVYHEEDTCLASGTFSPAFSIDGHTSTPWSFVFSPEQTNPSIERLDVSKLRVLLQT